MPPDSYVDWGAVHFYTPLNRIGEQIFTDEEKSKGLRCFKYAVDVRRICRFENESYIGKDKRQEPFGACRHFP